MNKESLIRSLDNLVEERWENAAQLRRNVEPIREAGRSADVLVSFASAAASYVLSEVLEYVDAVEENLENRFGAAAASAEMERLQNALRSAISDFRKAVEVGNLANLAGAQQLLVQHWDAFEQEHLNSIFGKSAIV